MEQPVDGNLGENLPGLKRFTAAALLVVVFLTALLLVANSGSADAATDHQGIDLNATPLLAAKGPTPTCTPCPCPADQYEPDNGLEDSRLLLPGERQQHSFDVADDEDWFRFENLVVGRTYSVSTFDLSGVADTYVFLYDRLGDQVAFNDDVDRARCGLDLQPCASSVKWRPDDPGVYSLVVRTAEYSSCVCSGYSIRFDSLGSRLPMVLLQPTPTPTWTSTATPTPTDTPTPTATPTHTPGPSPTPTATPTPPVLDYPQAVAVNPAADLIYVTSRSTDRVYMLNGTSLATLTGTVVGDQPWGIAYYAPLNKVYVASWRSGTVSVLDGTTLAVQKTITVGPNPTWVERTGGQIQLIAYGTNSLVTIDPNTDTIVRNVHMTRTAGAWALAYNASLDLTYVSSRDSKTITVVDANGSERTVISTGLSVGCEPYELDFNPKFDRLYNVCDVDGQRNDVVVVYQANGIGLSPRAEITVGSAGPDMPWGEDGRGGVAVNPTTGSLFVTNSYDNTVSVIDGWAIKLIGSVAVGASPFGIGVDPLNGRVYTANRVGDSISMFLDPR